MPSAGNIIRSVADDDELVWLKAGPKMSADPFGRYGREVAPIVRIIAKGARKLEEMVQANKSHLQIGRRFDVACKQRITITRVIRSHFQKFAHARQCKEKLLARSGNLLHFRQVYRSESVDPL